VAWRSTQITHVATRPSWCYGTVRQCYTLRGCKVRRSRVRYHFTAALCQPPHPIIGVKVHTELSLYTKPLGGVNVELHSFFTSAPGGRESSVSRSGLFTPVSTEQGPWWIPEALRPPSTTVQLNAAPSLVTTMTELSWLLPIIGIRLTNRSSI
jgi:hypothetical protein